jgi:hypothetical protein
VKFDPSSRFAPHDRERPAPLKDKENVGLMDLDKERESR